MTATRTDLLAPMPPAECAERLRAVVDLPMTMFGSKPLVGEVSEKRIAVRRRIGYRNSFQNRLIAEFSDEGGKTRLCCSLQSPNFEPVLIAAAVMVAVLVGGTFAMLFVSGKLTWAMLMAADPLLVALPGGVLVLLVGISSGVGALGRRLAKGEAEFMLGTIEKALGATRA